MSPCLDWCCSKVPQRVVISVLCASAMMVIAFKRKCIEETINLVTVNVPHTSPDYTYNFNDTCPLTYEGTEEEADLQMVTEYNWSGTTTRLIHHTFFFSSALGLVPAGLLVHWHGPRIIFGNGLLISSMVCLFQPFLVSQGPYFFMASVIIQGFSLCVAFPCIITIMVRWAPDNERSTIVGTIFGSFSLGRAISLLVFHVAFTRSSNLLTSHYVGGAVGLLWCIVWFSLAYNSPTSNPYISELELSLFGPSRDSRRSPDVPWREIFKSRPFLVLLLITCADEWKFGMMHTVVLITYYEDTLHVHTDGLMRMVEVAAFPTAVLGGVLSDWLINNDIISRTMCRKIFSFVGVMVPTFLTVFITEIGCDPDHYIAWQILIFLLFGFTYGSIVVNAIDLSTRYAGLISAMTYTAGMFVSLFPAYVAYAIIKDTHRLSEWSMSLWVSAMIVTTLSVPYFLYASGEKQQWALSRRSATLSLSEVPDTDLTQDHPSDQNQEQHEKR
ncbi:hypothetical protein J6590_001481 [Homalodisca vitripennis]|nr:hypothetical protein J6590_001481 [Homalodisca vitripennis]